MVAYGKGGGDTLVGRGISGITPLATVISHEHILFLLFSWQPQASQVDGL